MSGVGRKRNFSALSLERSRMAEVGVKDDVKTAVTFTAKDCERCRSDFPALQRPAGDQLWAWLDGPAGTQVPECVIEAVSECYRRYNVNTHGHFQASRDVDAAIQRARQAMAHFLGAAEPGQISFGANMTSLVIVLSLALARKMQAGDEILITQLDHEANRGPWLKLQERGMSVREVIMQANGHLDYTDFESKISEKPKLVAVGLASNALGTVNDVARIQKLCRDSGAWLVVDAVHYAPHFPIDASALDPDFLFCSAYKFYGPHVGILYSRAGLLDQLNTDALSCQDSGSIETGTLNHAALAGVTAAVSYISSWGAGDSPRDQFVSAMNAIGEYEHELASYYFKNVSTIPGVTVWGPDFSSGDRAPTVSITKEGIDPAEAARKLGDAGLQVWDGHFYAPRPVEVLGLADKGGLIRTGISMYNTHAEIDRLLNAIAKL